MVGASEALGGGGWAAAPTLGFGGGNSAAPGLFGSKSGRVLPSSSMIHRGEKSRVRDLASYPQREPSVSLQGKPILVSSHQKEELLHKKKKKNQNEKR